LGLDKKWCLLKTQPFSQTCDGAGWDIFFYYFPAWYMKHLREIQGFPAWIWMMHCGNIIASPWLKVEGTEKEEETG